MASVDGSKTKGGRAYRQHQSLKEYIRQRDGYTCQLCGAEGWIVDHIKPWRVGHDSTIGNLRVLCHACNLATRRPRKDARPSLVEWEANIRAELAQCQ